MTAKKNLWTQTINRFCLLTRKDYWKNVWNPVKNSSISFVKHLCARDVLVSIGFHGLCGVLMWRLSVPETPKVQEDVLEVSLIDAPLATEEDVPVLPENPLEQEDDAPEDMPEEPLLPPPPPEPAALPETSAPTPPPPPPLPKPLTPAPPKRPVLKKSVLKALDVTKKRPVLPRGLLGTLNPSTPTQTATISAQEIQAIGLQLRQCWRVPLRILNASKLTVSVRVTLGPDQTVLNVHVIPEASSTDHPDYELAKESVLRLFDDPRCKKLNFPPHFSAKEVTFRFNPTEAGG